MEEIEEDEYDQEEVAEAVVTHPEKKEDDDQKKNQYNPLVRTGVPFGGVINDIKRRSVFMMTNVTFELRFSSLVRAPWYLSDFTDAMNAQCVAAALFIYFACLSGAVAFGGLTATKTKNLIGIPETLIVSCVSGVLFALFAGQPLIITGCCGRCSSCTRRSNCLRLFQASPALCFSLTRLSSNLLKRPKSSFFP